MEDRFDVQIEQSGRALPISNHEVAIRRAPFDIVVTLRFGRGLYLSSSLEPDWFDAARRGQPLLAHFSATSVPAENLFDADQDLVLDDEPFIYKPGNNDAASWMCESAFPINQYLYYAGPDEHRFTEVRFEGETLIARRAVAFLERPPETLGLARYHIGEPSMIAQRIEDLREDSIYLVFVEGQRGSNEYTTEERENFEQKHPLQRTYLRLRFAER